MIFIFYFFWCGFVLQTGLRDSVNLRGGFSANVSLKKKKKKKKKKITASCGGFLAGVGHASSGGRYGLCLE